MALRDGMPKAKASSSHYFLTFSRGEKMRCVSMPPWALYAAIGVAPILLSVYLGATLYLVFRDDMLASLMARQSEQQYAYEDRLAAMRTQIDRVTGRQLLDQNTLEGRVHDLLSRQAQIESRAAIVATLAQQAGASGDATASISTQTLAKRSVNPLLAKPAGPALPSGASAFAPLAPSSSALSPLDAAKPRPETGELHSSLDPAGNAMDIVAANPDMPVETRLRALSGSLRQLETAQVGQVSALGVAARRSATRLAGAMRDAGLPVDKIVASAPASAKAVGGPFIPLNADPKGSPFEREVYRLQNDFLAAGALMRAARHAPLRRPLAGNLEITSPFGPRIDPFFGKMALHPGIDLREPTGTPARATAAGKVVSAGWRGGYGNMVEIDHGNGLVTRFGHLSAILVSEGQSVESGETIGRVGSTGRSTGSHLHYEVRVDGEPVDPMRFLRAGDKLAAGD